MIDIFRKWTKTYNSRNSTGFETRNIKTVHYGFEIIVPLHPIRLAHQKIKDSEKLTSLNQTLNTGSQKIASLVSVNYIYDMILAYCIFACFN